MSCISRSPHPRSIRSLAEAIFEVFDTNLTNRRWSPHRSYSSSDHRACGTLQNTIAYYWMGIKLHEVNQQGHLVNKHWIRFFIKLVSMLLVMNWMKQMAEVLIAKFVIVDSFIRTNGWRRMWLPIYQCRILWPFNKHAGLFILDMVSLALTFFIFISWLVPLEKALKLKIASFLLHSDCILLKRMTYYRMQNLRNSWNPQYRWLI